ncbi:hypothetical protein BSY18_4163 (plasmid) [Blastomonas sp. RAC04]|nr:hypothetical protein BSY18_4163 [Blastomonas sp. RAC04]
MRWGHETTELPYVSSPLDLRDCNVVPSIGLNLRQLCAPISVVEARAPIA